MGRHKPSSIDNQPDLSRDRNPRSERDDRHPQHPSRRRQMDTHRESLEDQTGAQTHPSSRSGRDRECFFFFLFHHNFIPEEGFGRLILSPGSPHRALSRPPLPHEPDHVGHVADDGSQHRSSTRRADALSDLVQILRPTKNRFPQRRCVDTHHPRARAHHRHRPMGPRRREQRRVLLAFSSQRGEQPRRALFVGVYKRGRSVRR